MQLCSLCLYSGHPQGHNVKLATTYIIEKRHALNAQLETVNHEIESLRENVKFDFSGFLDEVVMSLSELCQVHNSLQEFQDGVIQALDKVKGTNRIKDIEATNTNLQIFQAQLQDYMKPDKEDSDCSATIESSLDDTLTNQSVKESGVSPGIHQEKHSSPETVNTDNDENKQENDFVDHDTTHDEESVHLNTDGNITEDKKEKTDSGLTTNSEEKNHDYETKNNISRTLPFQFGQKASFQGFEFFKSYQVKDKLSNENMLHFPGLKNAWTSSAYGYSDKRMSVKKNTAHGHPANMEDKPLEGSQEDDGVKSTRLDFQDGRLLLHCLAKPSKTCLSLQVQKCYTLFLVYTAVVSN